MTLQQLCKEHQKILRRYVEALRDGAQALGVLTQTHLDGGLNRSTHLIEDRMVEQAQPDQSTSDVRSESKENVHRSKSDSDDDQVAPDQKNYVLKQLNDLKAIDEWLQGDSNAEPRLILGEVGIGKSIYLESIAYKLAGYLSEWLDQDEYRSIDAMPPVPVLLSRTELSILSRFDRAKLDQLIDFKLRYPDIIPAEVHEKPTRRSILLELLTRERKIIPLADGMDELPPQSRGKLITNLSQINKCFAVTSRPGYGVESPYKHFGDRRTHLRLRGLLPTQARSYADSKRVLSQFESMENQRIGPLLLRPFYLRVWCEEAGNGKVCTSSNELLEVVYERLLERQERLPDSEVSIKVEKDKFRTVEDFFRDWYVELAMHFAECEFSEQSVAQLGELLEPPDRFRNADGTSRVNFKAYAERLGLLSTSKSDGTCTVPKIPVMEFLVGRRLGAQLLSKESKERYKVVQKFRSWVFRLDLHNVLDHMFDYLYSSSRNRMARQLPKTDDSPLAVELINWCIAQTYCAGNELGSDGDAAVPCDDMTRPLAILAQRWATRVNDQVIDAVSNQLLRPQYHWSSSLFDTMPGTIIIELIEALILRFPAHESCVSNCEAWIEAIRAVADRVPAPHAEAVVNRLVESYPDSKQHYWVVRYMWGEAIRSAAGCVAESSIETVVTRWIEGLPSIEPDREVYDVWYGAIGSASAQVPEMSADALVVRWVKDFPGAEEGLVVRTAWSCAITAVAGRVVESSAESIICLLIDDFRWSWTKAIGAAAGRVGAKSAVAVVDRLIETYSRRSHYLHEEHVWAEAVGAAASRVREISAEASICRWIEEYDRADFSFYIRPVWAEAIRGAAGRVAVGSAEAVVDRLIEQFPSRIYDETILDGCIAWTNAIVAAAGRISEDSAEAIIFRWIEDFYRTDPHSEIRSVWAKVIAAAASRLKMGSGEDVVYRLIEAWPDAEQGSALMEAIAAAAGRVSERSAKAVVTRLIQEFPSDEHEGRQACWARAIEAAASRADRHHRYEVCNQLLLQTCYEFGGIVQQLVADSADLALIRIRPDNGDDGLDHSVVFRKTLLLSEVSAPPQILALLKSNGNSAQSNVSSTSHDPIKIGAALATLCQMANRKNPSTAKNKAGNRLMARITELVGVQEKCYRKADTTGAGDKSSASARWDVREDHWQAICDQYKNELIRATNLVLDEYERKRQKHGHRGIH